MVFETIILNRDQLKVIVFTMQLSEEGNWGVVAETETIIENAFMCMVTFSQWRYSKQVICVKISKGISDQEGLDFQIKENLH